MSSPGRGLWVSLFTEWFQRVDRCPSLLGCSKRRPTSKELKSRPPSHSRHHHSDTPAESLDGEGRFRIEEVPDSRLFVSRSERNTFKDVPPSEDPVEYPTPSDPGSVGTHNPYSSPPSIRLSRIPRGATPHTHHPILRQRDSSNVATTPLLWRCTPLLLSCRPPI